jgi:hypothetical protein
MDSASTQIIKTKPKLPTQLNDIANFNTAEYGKPHFGLDIERATGKMEMIDILLRFYVHSIFVKEVLSVLSIDIRRK